MRALYFFLFVLISIVPSMGVSEPQAESETIGRLPDGRAYRVDNEGNQVVDYIAELEATVDSLTRELASVEGELGTAGGSNTRNIPCENIITESSCEKPLQELRTSLQNTYSNERLSTESEINEYRTEITRLRKLVDTNASDARASLDYKNISENIENLSAQVAEAESRAASLKEKLDSTQSLILTLESELSNKNQEYELLKIKNSAASKRIESEQLSETSSSPSIEDKPQARVLVDPNGAWMTSPSRIRAMEALKGAVTSELNRLSTRVATRERLLNTYNSETVKIPSKVPNSSHGKTIEDLRSETQLATSGRELSEIRGEVNEIKSKVEEDIALLSRLSRGR